MASSFTLICVVVSVLIKIGTSKSEVSFFRTTLLMFNIYTPLRRKLRHTMCRIGLSQHNPKLKGKYFVTGTGKFQFVVPRGNTVLLSPQQVGSLTQFLRICCYL
jgi:hypothetical protein